MAIALPGAVAVVTGAASGIGAELAVRLAEKGAALALVDRDAAGLDALLERELEHVPAAAEVLVIDEIGPRARLRLRPCSHHWPIHLPHRFFKLPF